MAKQAVNKTFTLVQEIKVPTSTYIYNYTLSQEMIDEIIAEAVVKFGQAPTEVGTVQITFKGQ